MLVPRCSGDYNSSKQNLLIYKFSKKTIERKARVSALLRCNLVITTLLHCTPECRRHWPDDAKFVKVKSNLRPKNPLSVFSGVPKSGSSIQQNVPRKTNLSLSDAHNQSIDELDEVYMQRCHRFPRRVRQNQS